MADQPFSAHVRYQPGLAMIDLKGEIDSFAEPELTRVYTEAEAHNPLTVVLNFSGVNYINSTGIALIVGLLSKARKAHRSMVVFGLSEHYIEIFKITRLADYMTIYSDETSALSGALSHES